MKFPTKKCSEICLNIFQRFREGVGGRGLATSSAQNTAKKDLQNCVPLLTGEDRKKGAEKRPESVG